MTPPRPIPPDPDTEAATTTALLRAPAAIVSAAFVAGLVAGEVAAPGHILHPRARDLLRFAVVAFVMIPFLLPSRWYQPGRSVMRMWIVAAALTASVRAVYMSVGLYSNRPASDWLMVTALHLAQIGTLWLAVFAVRRRPMPEL
jgi:hypothetical protein